MVTPLLVAPPESAGSLAKPPSHLRMNGNKTLTFAICFFCFWFIVLRWAFACFASCTTAGIIILQFMQVNVKMSFGLVNHDSLRYLRHFALLHDDSFSSIDQTCQKTDRTGNDVRQTEGNVGQDVGVNQVNQYNERKDFNQGQQDPAEIM